MSYAPENGGWKKYGNAPVLGNTETGTFFEPFVLEDNGEYLMYFSWRPRKALALTTSTDGINWTEPRIILGPKLDTGWEDDLNRCAVVKNEDGYHMWYSGQARERTWIGYATSPDGYVWKRHSNMPVMIPEHPWEFRSVMCPHVLWDEEDGVFKMWYSGGETYEPDAIGYATSVDGVNWDKHPANPIFIPDDEFPWEQDKVTACQVDKRDGWYVMFYIGFEDLHTARIGIARSPDGITRWERCPHNPIIGPTPEAWDGDACYKPFAVWNPEKAKWLLWYNGRKAEPEYIGLVTHDGYDLGFGDRR